MDYQRCVGCDSDRFEWHGPAYVVRPVMIIKDGVAIVAGPSTVVRAEEAKGIIQCVECGRSHHWLKNIVIEKEQSTLKLYEDEDDSV